MQPRVQENAVLGVAENLYMYSRGCPVINEDTPEDPPTRKGLLRKQLHDRLVETAERDGPRLDHPCMPPTTTDREPFSRALFGTQLFLDPLFNGKRPRVVGSVDQPHTYTYVEDYGRALAVAALDPRAHGRAWIVPNDRTVTAGEAAELFFNEAARQHPVPHQAGRRKTLGTIPRPLIAGLGLFNPLLRELVEMLYQKEEPYVVDGGRFARLFSFSPTPLEEGVRRTIEWYRAAPHAMRPASENRSS